MSLKLYIKPTPAVCEHVLQCNSPAAWGHSESFGSRVGAVAQQCLHAQVASEVPGGQPPQALHAGSM